jgi:outer membrane lipoprotein SlyB
MIGKATVALFALATVGLTQPASAQNNTVGGALFGGALGGIIGGAATGSAGGAVAGALIGGATGALIGAEADRRRSYYWWRGGCYQAVQGGYVRISNRYCY